MIELTQSLYSIRQSLKHIDTNYNQVAKRINSIEHTRELYYDVQTSKAILEKLGPILSELDAFIKAQIEAMYAK
jgi:prefoldin subunit 5